MRSRSQWPHLSATASPNLEPAVGEHEHETAIGGGDGIREP
ncbi:MAG: hypothetical protein ABR592_13170 [Nitriliruptorales bacterium]